MTGVPTAARYLALLAVIIMPLVALQRMNADDPVATSASGSSTTTTESAETGGSDTPGDTASGTARDGSAGDELVATTGTGPDPDEADEPATEESPDLLTREETEELIELNEGFGHDGVDDFDPGSFAWPPPPPDDAEPEQVAAWVAVVLAASGPDGPAPPEMLAPHVVAPFLEEYQLATTGRISTTEPTVRSASLIDATVVEPTAGTGGLVVNVAVEVTSAAGFDVLGWSMRMTRAEGRWLVESVQLW